MKICLIGSTRFKEQFESTNHRLSLVGNIVYTVSCFNHADVRNLSDVEKEILDLVHLRKIMESDLVVIVSDENRYVGDSTKREIRWCKILGKPMRWADDIVPLSPDEPLNVFNTPIVSYKETS